MRNPMNNASAAIHFALYEFVRIFLPGFYVAFLVFLFIAGFSFTLLPFGLFEFGGIGFFVISLVAGLTLYAKETPKRRKAFRTNQPSAHLIERSKVIGDNTPLDEDNARRLYFYILNDHMPPAFQDKVFFFGMIYYVMISIRRISFWFTFIGIILLLVKFAATGHFFIEGIIPVAFVGVVYVLNVRYNKADRKMQENFQDQIFWLTMNHELVDALITKQRKTGAPS
jgi:membrane protein implicated in regulation of membrane protease activity